MSFVRYASISAVAVLGLVGTLYLEQKTNVIDKFHAQVGVEEYTIADAKNIVTGGKTGRSSVAMLATTSLDALELQNYLPADPSGWQTAQVVPYYDFIKTYSRSLNLGTRPMVDQLWPAGALSVSDGGKVVLDAELSALRHSDVRDIAAARYTNDLSDLMVSVEKLDEQDALVSKSADDAVRSHLGRPFVRIGDIEFMVLTGDDSPFVLLRAYVGSAHVVDVRGTAFIAEIEEILEAMPLNRLVGGEPAVSRFKDLKSL